MKSARTAALALTCGVPPPWDRQTVPPSMAYLPQRLPVDLDFAVHFVAGMVAVMDPTPSKR